MAETTTDNEATAKSKAVLCVDANETAMDVIEQLIGHRTEFWRARNFKQAVAAIKRQAFDLVFCDITAESVQGMDVLSILNSLYPSTPVIVTTEDVPGDWTHDADALVAFAGFRKPFEPTALKIAIEEVLGCQEEAEGLVFGQGEIGRAVQRVAAAHEQAADAMARLLPDERVEICTVAEVLERFSPFFGQK